MLGLHFDLPSFQQRLCQPTMKQCTRSGGKMRGAIHVSGAREGREWREVSGL